MAAPDLRAIDLNLLVVLRALLAERHVTRAARSVGLSQSATSHALARLRELFDDALLVRSGSKLELTPRALEISATLERVLLELEGLVLGPAPFNPRTARRNFTLGMVDYGQAILCGPLLTRLAEEAPHVNVEVTAAPNLLDLLERGEIDLAATVQDEPRSGHNSRELFEDEFVCVVRARHPVLKSRLTLRRYLELRHVVVAPYGAAGSLVDSALAERGLERRVAARIPNFLAAPIVIANTDFINTGPARLARLLAERHALRILPVPVPLPRFKFSLVWHKRHDADPAHRWLRDRVVAAAT
jgi:DNA-binding transcriptional LysR family regulator